MNSIYNVHLCKMYLALICLFLFQNDTNSMSNQLLTKYNTLVNKNQEIVTKLVSNCNIYNTDIKTKILPKYVCK